MKELTVKPGKRYLAIAAFFPLVAVFTYWWLSQVPSSGNPAEEQSAVNMLCAFLLLPGVVIALFYKATCLTVDDGGMVSSRLFRPAVRCSWDEVSGVELKEEGLAFPCVIRANGRKIAKITRAFDGYDQLLDLLTERGMLRESGLMDRAKTWVALDRMKMKDVIGKRKKQ